MMRKEIMIVAIVGIAIMTGLANADVIAPTDATASTFYPGRDPDTSIINGNGLLTGDGSAGSTHTNAAGEGPYWSTYPGDTAPEITFDLGTTYDVDTMRIWNWNYNTLTAYGVNDVDVYAGETLGSMSLVGSYSLTQADDTSTYTGQDIAVSMSGVRYIKFDITSFFTMPFNWGGLSEVRFEGTALAPTITGQPVPLTVAAEDTAVFSVTTKNITGYQWQVDDVNIIGETTDTLTITDVQKEDEGFYSCLCTGDGTTIESNAAQLLTKRLIGHWPFESDPNDVVDGVVSSVAGTVSYVPGIVDSNAADFGTGASVTLTGTEDFYNFPPRGSTMSMWIKTDGDTNVVSFFSKYDGVGFSNYQNQTDWVAVIEGPNYHVVPITIGEWNFFVLTYDADTETLSIYKNGLLEDSLTQAPSDTSLCATPAVIGGANAGLIDDVKIYSYARTAEQVAQEYVDGTGIPLCFDPPELDIAPVGALDCKVNMLDFAEFAKAWLEAGNLVTPAP